MVRKISIPSGTVVKLGGVPIALLTAQTAATSSGNAKLIESALRKQGCGK